MTRRFVFAGALMCLFAGWAAAHDGHLNDAQIAHIAYTAGQLDIAAAEQALDVSTDPAVRAFAEEMARDHKAVNDQALALVTKLNVKPEDNATSKALTDQAAVTLERLSHLSGAAFDEAYIANEVAFHGAVNAALRETLIPSAANGDLKSLLETGLKLFEQHELHARHIAEGR